MLFLTALLIYDSEHIEGADTLSTEQLLLHIYLARIKITIRAKKVKVFDCVSFAHIPPARH